MKRIAVVTPYYDEPIEYLQTCHQSVIKQSYFCDHILVSDGFYRSEINFWDCVHIALPSSHHDIGSTPRVIGSMHAIGLHYDYIAFLDADNWYASTHIESLLNKCLDSNAAIGSSSRMLCRLDSSLMGICPITKPESFIDTSCMFLGQEAFPLIQQWVLMPSYAHLIGDRVFWYHILSSGLNHTHTGEPTLFYRCQKEGLYRMLGESVPKGVKSRPNYEAAHDQWLKDGYPSLFI